MLGKKFKTQNIANTISKFAAENALSSSNLSFNIDELQTYIKTVSTDAFVAYPDDIHNYYLDSDKIINEHVNFKQLYTITIKKNAHNIIKLHYEIKQNKNKTNPYIIIYPDSIIPYKEYQAKEIYILLVKEINRIKAYNKILIKIFDKSMLAKIKAFTKYLYQGKFIKHIKITIFDGIEPEMTRNAKLIMHYKKKKTIHQVIEVDKDEVLIEYIKPVFGKNGLNAYGKIVSNIYGNNEEDLKAEVDLQTIQIIEDENKKLYKSKIKGYIEFNSNKLRIDNKIKMNRLSRVQESIAKDEDNNIEIIISQNDTDIDSIGEGVELVSETIHVNGHVGAKTKLEATNLLIEGATHGDSEQEAKFVTINRHKGKLRCHEAKIKLLEGGEVHATNVEIESTLGGSIFAENVIIGHVKSNLKIYASNSITIKRISGENNLLKINYLDIPTLKSKYDFITQEIDDLKYEIEKISKYSPDKVPSLKDRIYDLKINKKNIKESSKRAKITIEEPLKGLNTIIFTIDDENELIYKTDSVKYDSFYLEETQTNIRLHPTNKKISKND